MLNAFQIQAMVYHLAVAEDLTADSVFQRIRREHPDVVKRIKAPQVEKLVGHIKDQVAEATGPMSLASMALHFAEVGLRGDLMAALSQLELTNPHDVRDVEKLAGHLGSREVGGPADMQDAIDYLAEAGVNVDDYRGRLTALYPPQPDGE